MFKLTSLIGAACLVIALPTSVLAKQAPVQEFESLSIIVEENATDGDTEIVIFAKTEEEGLARLVVRGPDHKVVFTSKSHDYGRVGIREYALETAEPAGGVVLNAYPEGTYTVIGRTMTGVKVKGTMELNHSLPVGPGFTPNGDIVSAGDPIFVQWDEVGGSAYRVEIENDDSGFNLTVALPAGTTSFVVAPNTLQSGTEYDIAIGVTNEFGNVVAVEGSFETLED